MGRTEPEQRVYTNQKSNRFDANTCIALSQAMDRHDITRSDQSYEAALSSIQQPTLVVAIDSNILYPPIEQQELANLIPNAELAWLSSSHGHDAFLIEMDALNHLVVQFRQEKRLQSSSPKVNAATTG